VIHQIKQPCPQWKTRLTISGFTSQTGRTWITPTLRRDRQLPATGAHVALSITISSQSGAAQAGWNARVSEELPVGLSHFQFQFTEKAHLGFKFARSMSSEGQALSLSPSIQVVLPSTVSV